MNWVIGMAGRYDVLTVGPKSDLFVFPKISYAAALRQTLENAHKKNMRMVTVSLGIGKRDNLNLPRAVSAALTSVDDKTPDTGALLCGGICRANQTIENIELEGPAIIAPMSVGQERVSIISAMLTGNREPRVFDFGSIPSRGDDGADVQEYAVTQLRLGIFAGTMEFNPVMLLFDKTARILEGVAGELEKLKPRGLEYFLAGAGRVSVNLGRPDLHNGLSGGEDNLRSGAHAQINGWSLKPRRS